MRFLATWLGNPGEYWLNIVLLVVLIAAGVWAIRKVQTKRR
ncbi:MAG: hypothetical protein ACXWRE_01270 [Pseudobdellovibrionaceae bacterium]